MSIELTSLAADEIRRTLREQELDEDSYYVRVGATGFGPRRQFTLELAELDADREAVVKSQGIRVCFSREDEAMLEGVKINYKDVGGVRGFTFEVPKAEISRRKQQFTPDAAPPREPQIRDVLRTVIDPEVGINILDLGLVYGIALDERVVRVTMTMTTPACPMGEHIRDQVQSRVLAQFAGVERVEVEIVWDPPWSSDKISPEGKRELGWST